MKEQKLLKQLTEKERAMLADFHEMIDLRKVLEKALVLYQRDQAAWVLTSAPDHTYTMHCRGRLEGSQFITDLAHEAYRAEQKRRS